MARAFVFPGQASQAVGMGQALAEAFPVAREVFEEVDEALKQGLSRLMFRGPPEDLVLTENAQPAIMAVSIAVVRVLEREGGLDVAKSCAYVAGHSLGEYSALTAVGSLRLPDTARLLKIRGRAMQEAVPVGEGAMAALIGLDLETARAVAAEAAGDEVCTAANDNAPGQVVLSGNKAAVERAVALAAERGARRSMMLPVSAPFHCELMQPAAEAMDEALSETDLSAPAVPLVSNVTADAVREPDAIRGLLVRQVTAPVRWRECVLYMRDHDVDTLVELGAGKILTGLARRIDRELTALSVETPDEVDALVKSL